ncbi:helix-turn-helix transcriptional regulator [Ectothiorhodospiraceae bacterium WFHF3C12]|nr:helix-turn-helix transcriptional regulator [Ectothiorhodospiraceae bacterium WFHF3C12]
MTKTANSQGGSSQRTTTSHEAIDTGQASVRTSSAAAVIDLQDYKTPTDDGTAKFTDIDDLVADWSEDPETNDHLSNARHWLAENFFSEAPMSLKGLRLRAGLSQRELAKLAQTSQPQIARLERGVNQVWLSTCRRLSEVLGVDLNTIADAIENQRRES